MSESKLKNFKKFLICIFIFNPFILSSFSYEKEKFKFNEILEIDVYKYLKKKIYTAIVK